MLDQSLRRLQSDYVDLFQLHNPDPDIFRNGPLILDKMQALCDKGRIRAYGVSVKSPQEGSHAIREHDVPVIQANLNMMDLRAVESGLLSTAEEYGVGVIARTPLCFGFLSGTIASETEFGEGDHRRAWPAVQRERWAEGAMRLFQTLGIPAGQTATQVALRFCLSFPPLPPSFRAFCRLRRRRRIRLPANSGRLRLSR